MSEKIELPMEADCCGTCRFWTNVHGEEDERNARECRRYAPTRIHRDLDATDIHRGTRYVREDTERLAFWPETHNFDWCGEWQKRPAGDPGTVVKWSKPPGAPG